MTVLIVVILIPIIVFATTSFITSSLLRYTTQNRNIKALYLAQAGIQRAIYKIRNGAPGAPLTDFTDHIPPSSDDTALVQQTDQQGSVYQFKSIGTSVAVNYPTLISRMVSVQYNDNTNNISLCAEGDGTGFPPLCSAIWWPFSEGSGYATGTSPYRGTLTPSTANGPAWTTDLYGAAGRALNFNQSTTTNYVVVPDSSGLDLTTSGTVMAWIRPSAIPNAAMQTIVHKGGTTTATNAYALFLFRQSTNQGRVRFWIYNTAGTQYVVSGATNMGRNTWYHIAGTWDSTGLQVFRNGVSNGTLASANRVARTNANPLYMGASGTLAAAQKFAGKIDEVYIYGCRKTEAEIKAYYNSTCAGSGATPCPQP